MSVVQHAEDAHAIDTLIHSSPARTILRDDPRAMEHEVTEMAALAGRFVNSTSRHVFLTGKAGTGKTTFLHQLAASTHKRFVIIAPTGIAALNAKGVTIHSQFMLPPGSFIPERNMTADVAAMGNFFDRDMLSQHHPMNAMRRAVLRDVDLLIIDEVSMLRADVLDAIDHRMRSVKRQYSRSFGGAQVLLIGDLYQLPPVVKDRERAVMERFYKSPHFFEAKALAQEGFVHLELDRIFRQKDEHFIHLLNNFRNNTVTAEDVRTLNAHYRAQLTDKETEGVVTLTTHNNTADELNRQALLKLKDKSHFFDAELDGDFPESMYPLPLKLELRVGAQVMFTRNDADKVYFNGKMARVVRISDKDAIEVEMIDGTASQDASAAEDGSRYVLKKEIWENKRYVVNADTKEQSENIIGRFTQFPIKLAWAITVHKSQGLTFDKAIIDVGNAFAPGQVYVALSRLRSIEGLLLRTRIDPSVVTSDKDVVAFTARKEEKETLPALLREQQQHYLQQLTSTTFDLQNLLFIAERVFKGHEETWFEDQSIRQALVDLVETLKKQTDNTIAFRSQLARLLSTNAHDELLARLEKGSSYYSDLLAEHMGKVIRNNAILGRLSGTKAYREDLSELDAALMKKLSEIGKCVHVAQCILGGAEVTRNAAVEKALKDRRQVMLDLTGAYIATLPGVAPGKSGRVRKGKRSEPGYVRAPKRTKAEIGKTYDKTYELHKQGLTLEEVAKQRSLSKTTIEGHFAKGIAEGHVDIDKVMPVEFKEAIASWMREHIDQGLNAAQAHFDGRFDYGELRMVQAWIKKGDV